MAGSNIDSFSILIVDDDRSFRSILKTIFSTDRFSVATAEDGGSALQLIEKQRYDLVITDLQMPEVDGVSLSRILQNRYPNTQIILMTGLTDDERYKQFIESTKLKCLEKPFRRKEVLSIANRLLETQNINSI